MVDISRSLRVHRGHVVATGKAIHNPSHAAGVAAAMGVISSGERRSAQEVHRRANAARHAWADVLDEDCADDGGEGRGRAGATEQRGQCPHVVNVGTQTEEVGGADSRPPQDDGRGEGIARAPLPAAERPPDRSCETVSVETIAAMERRLQRLEQVEVDALLAGRIADYGVALEDAAKRITDLEMEGAAAERRLMEQVSELTDSIPDIVVKAAGNTCRQTAEAHIAKVRSERHVSLTELATLTYRVGDGDAGVSYSFSQSAHASEYRWTGTLSPRLCAQATYSGCTRRPPLSGGLHSASTDSLHFWRTRCLPLEWWHD